MRTFPVNAFQKIHRVSTKTRGPLRAFLSCALSAAALGACAVSTQKEVKMGVNSAAQIAKQLPLITDPEVLRYINVLGDSLANVTDERGLEWHFNIVDSKEVNAFAVPGGYIYVNRGLIERAQSMSQVAGVIAHEIGHVTKRHSIKQMQKAQGTNVGMTLGCIVARICGSGIANAAAGIGTGVAFANFSRSDEAEADDEGIRTLIKAGIDPNGLPEMFRILLDERKKSPGSVEAWFATHPMEEDRIAATLALIKTFAPSKLEGLTRDTQNFHAFKDRLASLPPSPSLKK
jgi:predicted Zn-dependent protease